VTVQYYYASYGQSVGPLSLEQLLKVNLQPQSLVWKSGLPEWVRAISLPELAVCFPGVNAPPPFSANTQQQAQQQYQAPSYIPESTYAPKFQARKDPNDPSVIDLGYPPKTYLTESILLTLLGGFISCIGVVPGIVAIVYGSNSANFYKRGQFANANKASKDALLWVKITCWISFGILVIVLLFAVMFSFRGTYGR
jgi:hypothetical protein